MFLSFFIVLFPASYSFYRFEGHYPYRLYWGSIRIFPILVRNDKGHFSTFAGVCRQLERRIQLNVKWPLYWPSHHSQNNQLGKHRGISSFPFYCHLGNIFYHFHRHFFALQVISSNILLIELIVMQYQYNGKSYRYLCCKSVQNKIILTPAKRGKNWSE